MVVQSEEESEERLAPSRKRSEEHRVFTKSTARDGTEGGRRIPGGVGMRSKSPSGMINGTTRARVLTEQDLANARPLKNTVAKFEIKGVPKKSATGTGTATAEGSENDSTVTKQ